MTCYAIGQIGHPVRVFLDTSIVTQVAMHLSEGELAIPVDGVPSPRSSRYRIGHDGTYVEPIAPTLAEVRAARWREAQAYRNGRQEGGCATPLGLVDTDADSQRKINGAALAAMIAGAGFVPIAWTMADNVVVEHDGPAIIAMGMAVVTFLAACQAAGTVIRDEIEAAPDAGAIAAINITAGYPG